MGSVLAEEEVIDKAEETPIKKRPAAAMLQQEDVSLSPSPKRQNVQKKPAGADQVEDADAAESAPITTDAAKMKNVMKRPASASASTELPVVAEDDELEDEEDEDEDEDEDEGEEDEEDEKDVEDTV